MNEQVYIPLLDEGTDVWRPAPARHMAGDAYEVLRPDDYDPADEHWKFLPGSIVVCEKRNTADGPILAAVRLQQDVRRTA